MSQDRTGSYECRLRRPQLRRIRQFQALLRHAWRLGVALALAWLLAAVVISVFQGRGDISQRLIVPVPIGIGCSGIAYGVMIGIECWRDLAFKRMRALVIHLMTACITSIAGVLIVFSGIRMAAAL